MSCSEEGCSPNPILRNRPEPELCEEHGDPYVDGLMALIESHQDRTPDIIFDLPDQVIAKFEPPSMPSKCFEGGAQHIRKGCGHPAYWDRCNSLCVGFEKEKSDPSDHTCPRCECPICMDIYARERLYRSIRHVHEELLQAEEEIYGGADEELAEATYEMCVRTIREAVQQYDDLSRLPLTILKVWLSAHRQLCYITDQDHIAAAVEFRIQADKEFLARVEQANEIIALDATEMIVHRLYPNSGSPPEGQEIDDMRMCLRDWFDDPRTFDHYVMGGPGYYTVDREASQDKELEGWFPLKHHDWLVSILPYVQQQRDLVSDAYSITIDDDAPVECLAMSRQATAAGGYRLEFELADRSSLLAYRRGAAPPLQ